MPIKLLPLWKTFLIVVGACLGLALLIFAYSTIVDCVHRQARASADDHERVLRSQSPVASAAATRNTHQQSGLPAQVNINPPRPGGLHGLLLVIIEGLGRGRTFFFFPNNIPTLQQPSAA
ncbi:hypothetical protein CPB83DRAFT_846190 [Crepidotus variabilis]|uniref:Uncharacterized protein n=1 Tax=Crepidotus variabilis TaxID=179855 RepID=A0A9P6EQ90_9AGAR|nr:hypothetical protein CPB83DRAFT_846190 [Crepidotus variabilis]